MRCAAWSSNTRWPPRSCDGTFGDHNTGSPKGMPVTCCRRASTGPCVRKGERRKRQMCREPATLQAILPVDNIGKGPCTGRHRCGGSLTPGHCAGGRGRPAVHYTTHPCHQNRERPPQRPPSTSCSARDCGESVRRSKNICTTDDDTSLSGSHVPPLDQGAVIAQGCQKVCALPALIFNDPDAVTPGRSPPPVVSPWFAECRCVPRLRCAMATPC